MGKELTLTVGMAALYLPPHRGAYRLLDALLLAFLLLVLWAG